MLNKIFAEEKGFTMIELIIVIAIIGIIGAIIAPNFTKMTVKAKVKADVASVIEVNRQISLYIAEKGKTPENNQNTTLHSDDSAQGGLQELVATDYLDKLPKPQTAGIQFEYIASSGKVRIGKGTGDNKPDAAVIATINGLSEADKELLVTGSTDW